jgi:hypothetical protein
MLRITQRALTPEEQKGVVSRLSFVPWQRRARADHRAGVAQVVYAGLRRAYRLSSCFGVPCCANWYLLETEAEAFLHIESWEYLHADGDRLPGNRLRIEYLPETRRILLAELWGRPLDLLDAFENRALAELRDGWKEVELLDHPDLTCRIRDALEGHQVREDARSGLAAQRERGALT